MQIARIGLDLAKYVFEIHGIDAHGKSRCCARRFVVTPCQCSSQTCRRVWSARRHRTARTFGRRRFPTLVTASDLISPQFVSALCEVQQER